MHAYIHTPKLGRTPKGFIPHPLKYLATSFTTYNPSPTKLEKNGNTLQGRTKNPRGDSACSSFHCTPKAASVIHPISVFSLLMVIPSNVRITASSSASSSSPMNANLSLCHHLDPSGKIFKRHLLIWKGNYYTSDQMRFAKVLYIQRNISNWHNLTKLGALGTIGYNWALLGTIG